MDGEQVEGLPSVLRDWIETRADETGRSRDELLARAVAVDRLLEDDGDSLPDPAVLDEADAVASRLDVIEARVDELNEELDEKIDDVRSRVIQVKRETDAKAEAGHDHPDLRETAELAPDIAADVDELRDRLAELDEAVEDGFANYEEVLEYLTDTADDHDAKLSTVATVLADVRARVSTLEAREARRRAAADLKAEANRLGVTTADCEGCGSTIRLGLLSTPECPHCGSIFEAVEPASGFFGSPSLTVGAQPALEGETVDDDDPDAIFDEG
ncbi:hypothetical protein [Halobaculum gomorrense]|uniref:Uncharacterized protein n=1 Tax=Halobaculum gomorrense TaxID=43928 RepID=A0A1M5MED6_9EURY|nr:hypothetical protein [Halobaculum gomorrense]SHG75571.1 hypothetical protein SAMN05443636_0983 [Halobaculum gomorrense]